MICEVSKLLVTWVSRKGGRKINEDSVGKTKENGILCVAAADGLGGYEGGKIASKLAVQAILESFAEKPEISKETVDRCIEDADRVISEYADSHHECRGMASTAVVLLVKGNKAVWGNVGDSRLYLLRKNRIAEVTEDHSVAFGDFMNKRIEYNDIRTSPNQNKLTAALGLNIKKADVSEITTVDQNTSFLICTDGWWEYVNEDEMEDTAKAASGARDWLMRMLEIRENNAPANSDNYTAATVTM